MNRTGMWTSAAVVIVAAMRDLEEHARQGRSEDEVVAAMPTRDFDMRIGVANSEPFVRQAYGGVLAARRRV